MGRSSYSGGKRAREADKARKQKEKAAKRKRRREEGPRDVPIALASEVQAVEEVPEGEEGAEQAVRKGPPCRLFVGGLAWETDEEGLRKTFEGAGEVVEVKLILDRDGRSRGFGFVTMADRKAGKAAISGLDGFELDGRNLKVSLATERR